MCSGAGLFGLSELRSRPMSPRKPKSELLASLSLFGLFGKNCGKFVQKVVGKFVGKKWKRLWESRKRSDFGGKSGDKSSFARDSGKVLPWVFHADFSL